VNRANQEEISLDYVPSDHQDHDCHDEPRQRRKGDEVVPVSVLYVDVSDQEAHRSIVQVAGPKTPIPFTSEIRRQHQEPLKD
jgi:hypothetical protein